MKKPFYKRLGFWVIVIVIGGIIGLTTGNDDTLDQAAPVANEEAQPAAAEPITEPTTESATEPTEAPTATAETPEMVEPSPKPDVEITSEPLDEAKVLEYTINLTGKTFIKTVDVGKDSINVNYFKNFKEYKEENTGSMVTEAEYKDYFSTGDQINKILMEESSRLFKEFPSASSIGIFLPFDGKTNSVTLSKEEIEKFYKVDFNTLTSDDEWRGRISNPFFNDEDREMFVAEFVDVE